MIVLEDQKEVRHRPLPLSPPTLLPSPPVQLQHDGDDGDRTGGPEGGTSSRLTPPVPSVFNMMVIVLEDQKEVRHRPLPLSPPTLLPSPPLRLQHDGDDGDRTGGPEGGTSSRLTPVTPHAPPLPSNFNTMETMVIILEDQKEVRHHALLLPSPPSST